MRGGGRCGGHGELVGIRRQVAVGVGAGQHVVVGVKGAGQHVVVGLEGALAGLPQAILYRRGLA
jgi:hypothetical protein